MIVTEALTEPRILLQARFAVTGAVWDISTNSQEVIAIMQDEFQPVADAGVLPDLKLYLDVQSESPDQERTMRPYFRALEHLYYGTFGPGDSMLVDQLRRRVVASLSAATVRDVRYWKRVLLPCLVGIASSSVGVTPVHCACVVKIGRGLLIHGESGAGKSTLALSLSMNGFSYLSDDCTYVSDSEGGLRCWGLSAPLKLLPDSVAFFPRLSGRIPTQTLNGELAFEVYPEDEFGILRSRTCTPEWLVFLERNELPIADFRTISKTEAVRRLGADLEMLPPCIAQQRDRQTEMIGALVQRECWVLRHGLAPGDLTKRLAEFCCP